MRRNADDLVLDEKAGRVTLVRMTIYQREEGATLPFIAQQTEWCVETCKGDFAPWFDPEGAFVFLFVDPDDAFAYRIRWQ